ncbi:hypothetical protein [Candidatus Nitrospira allomarina]|jgi:hypothetical protein|uniref:Uncharacterized protein n=1 Tax=Candidatus Nitrospira allomarina TaxID=3020900 RepID=A0AA96GC50_9BACT|nr:hypothetical protein [Candidatus Nitrospira allomarina]WNM57430.1 hypothetical protein PP769_15870 [Candidatus Nitrospira allomarina]
MRVQAGILGFLYGVVVITGSASGNLFEGKESVEEAICKKMAMDYANDPNSLTVQAIAQLQICLAQTLKKTDSPVISKKFERESPSPSRGIVDSTLPTPPTPPTPPKSLKIR